eukprot:TRINITY_DN1524_c1_g1_i1.p1 TRINITY_DN1524_c1_g1~~TRINITY_DN1524_c1_g1_i1.p1  ORF type:complete len:648 (-),score=259.55 TRINITY_DN1524_c1_g1_i1:28-1851(-)
MEDELLRVGMNPPPLEHLEEANPLIGFGFKKFVFDFPLLQDQKDNFTHNLNELLRLYKEMNLSSREERGKKPGPDAMFRRCVKGLIEFYYRLLHTSTAREVVNRKTPLAERRSDSSLRDLKWAEVKGMSAEVRQMEEEKVLPVVTQLQNFWIQILNEPDGHTAVEIYEMVKNTDHMMALPPKYIIMIKSAIKVASYRLYEEFILDTESRQHCNMLKNFYRFTPFLAIQGILKVGNPVKIIKGVINLMFARPLGTRSVIQRIIKVAQDQDEEHEDEDSQVEIQVENSTSPQLEEPKEKKKSFFSFRKPAPVQVENPAVKKKGEKEKALSKKKLRKLIDNKEIVSKIENYINKTERNYDLVREHNMRAHVILEDKDCQPQISQEVVDTLTHVQVEAITTYFVRCIKERDYELTAAFMGKDEVRDTIEQLVSAFYKPLLAVYEKAGFHVFFKHFSEFLKALIDINSEREKRTSEEIIDGYERCIEQIMEHVYFSLHNILKQDDGTVREIFDWFLQNYYSPKTASLDIEEVVFAKFNLEEREKLIEELDELNRYKAQKKQQNKMKLQLELEGKTEEVQQIVIPPEPVTTMVPLLKDAYVEKVSLILPQLLE